MHIMSRDASAATRAKNKYRDKVYDQINVVVRKGKKADLQNHAAGRNESLNAFVNRAIDETLERDIMEYLPEEGAAEGVN
jgi:predicted HicB family RNase H-like nuclease